jgi:Bacterial regulatory proteins, luxR family
VPRHGDTPPRSHNTPNQALNDKLSGGTVKTHIGRLLAKLDARDRSQLVIVRYETGLVGATPA